MKRFHPFIAIITLLAVLVLPAWGETQAVIGADSDDRSPAAPIATAIAAVTGIAISPLLGTGAYGAYLHFKTPEAQRADLPWFAKINFWGPALLLVGAVAVKDALGATLPPGWKKPLDILETVENKISGLVAAGAVVPITMSTVGDVLVGAEATQRLAAQWLPADSGLAMIQMGAIDGSSFINLLTVPFGIAIFAIVWMASHAINVLILLSPWGAIDAALKAARTGLLGLIALASSIDPWIGAIGSFIVIIISYFVAGWAFRLTIFGSIFSWDFFTLRRRRYRVMPDHNAVFSAGKLKDVPPRTYGRLVRRGDGLVFVYRPWLVLPPREAPVPATKNLTVGRGILFSLIEVEGGGLALLPPRYRTHEEEFAETYGMAGVRDAGLRRAWSWIRETMGFGGKVAPAAAA